MDSAHRVFGIGLRKTGTRSLASATRELGFRTLHKGGSSSSQAVLDAERAGRPLLDGFAPGFAAFFDVEALVHRFVELDAAYPGSRFILSTRDEDAWLSSMERHALANQERKAAGEYHGDFLVVDPARWKIERAAHEAAVRDYFSGRPASLLEIDVTRGEEGWERLAPFLGRPIPAVPFPWENRNGAGTYRPEAPIKALRRRIVAARRRLRRHQVLAA